MTIENVGGIDGRNETPNIRVVFMGTPDFSQAILKGVLDTGYTVVASYTRPDKPVGRKHEVTASPVKQVSIEHGIPVEQPVRFDDETVEKLRSYLPDIILVAAYGRILPEAVLEISRFGCVNEHASLLPRWRGASPVQSALLSGDTETGVTIMLMDAGMDTGAILSQEAFPISETDTRDSLLSRMAQDGVRLLQNIIPRLVEGNIEPKPQDDTMATLCTRIGREDGRISWSDSAQSIYGRYRGLHPWPGIFTFWKRPEGPLRLKLARISIQKTDYHTSCQIGTVLKVEEKIAVQTGNGLIFIEEIQPEGKGVMPIADYLNGRPDFLGTELD